MNHKETLWNKDKSIVLSRALLLLFAAALVLLDLACLYACWSHRYLALRLNAFFSREKVLSFTACAWLCSVPGFWLLFSMNHMLKNMQSGSVFTPENVKLPRTVSYCRFAAALICMIFAMAEIISLSAIAIAAGFVGLIVRIVKNVFEQAIAMKDELDFTV